MFRKKSKRIDSFNCSRAGRDGEGRISSNARTTNRLTWTTHKTYGMGASGRLCCKLLPVDPPRMPLLPDLPGNDKDTDVQTRGCARFKNSREFGGKSTTDLVDEAV